MENNITSHLTAMAQKSGKSRRGFASMDKDRHKLVSSKGGKAMRATYSNRSSEPTPASTSQSPVN